MDQDRRLSFRLTRGDGLLVHRLLRRDGFTVVGPSGGRTDRRAELSVVVESEGREARVREVMARWAPEAVRVDRG